MLAHAQPAGLFCANDQLSHAAHRPLHILYGQLYNPAILHLNVDLATQRKLAQGDTHRHVLHVMPSPSGIYRLLPMRPGKTLSTAPAPPSYFLDARHLASPITWRLPDKYLLSDGRHMRIVRPVPPQAYRAHVYPASSSSGTALGMCASSRFYSRVYRTQSGGKDYALHVAPLTPPQLREHACRLVDVLAPNLVRGGDVPSLCGDTCPRIVEFVEHELAARRLDAAADALGRERKRVGLVGPALLSSAQEAQLLDAHHWTHIEGAYDYRDVIDFYSRHGYAVFVDAHAECLSVRKVPAGTSNNNNNNDRGSAARELASRKSSVPKLGVSEFSHESQRLRDVHGLAAGTCSTTTLAAAALITAQLDTDDVEIVLGFLNDSPLLDGTASLPQFSDSVRTPCADLFMPTVPQSATDAARCPPAQQPWSPLSASTAATDDHIGIPQPAGALIPFLPSPSLPSSPPMGETTQVDTARAWNHSPTISVAHGRTEDDPTVCGLVGCADNSLMHDAICPTTPLAPGAVLSVLDVPTADTAQSWAEC